MLSNLDIILFNKMNKEQLNDWVYDHIEKTCYYDRSRNAYISFQITSGRARLEDFLDYLYIHRKGNLVHETLYNILFGGRSVGFGLYNSIMGVYKSRRGQIKNERRRANRLRREQS